MILLLYVNFKYMNIVQQPHEVYKFQKYITTNDLKALYHVYYNNKQMMTLTLIMDKYVQTFSIFGGKINYQGEQINLETTITVGYGIFELGIPNLNIKIVFKLNSIVKYINNDGEYDVDHVTCRFYN